jgi:uncharacterized protein YggE
MKKPITLLLLLVCTVTSLLHAQVDGNGRYAPAAAGNSIYKAEANYQYNNQQTYTATSRAAASSAAIINNNEITITMNGLMNIVADNYVAMFNIVQVGETAGQTDDLMNDRIQTFKRGLSKAGFDTSQVKTDMISFVPKFEFQAENKIFSKTYNEVPSGFELQKNLMVSFKNSQQLDAILTAAAAAEIYDLAKVDYFVPDMQRSMDTLRIRCLQSIKGKCKNYEILGFKLDTLRKVIDDNFSTTFPETRYFSYKAFSRPSLGSIKKKDKAQVTYSDAAQVYSKFYNQVDYDHYDLVINPVINEPVVQLSYSVAVKYFLKDEATPKNNYYVITAGGQLQQINPK